MKKHVSQMTQREITLLTDLCMLGDYHLCSYSQRRLRQRNIEPKQVLKAIKEGKLIEYHYVSPLEHRVLLRGITPISGFVICVVLDLFTGLIVTAYKNSVWDKHFTLRQKEYDANIDILNKLYEE